MDDAFWVAGVRAAGFFQLLTVALAHFTPIPPNWDENLGKLPDVHRRFAIAQNVFIGAVMVFCGLVSLGFAPDLVTGSATARVICAGIACWWGGRLFVLPWLRVWPELSTKWLRAGFVLLHAECAIFAVAYCWPALRGLIT